MVLIIDKLEVIIIDNPSENNTNYSVLNILLAGENNYSNYNYYFNNCLAINVI